MKRGGLIVLAVLLLISGGIHITRAVYAALELTVPATLPDKIASVIYCEKGYLIIEEWPGESLPGGEAL